MVALSIETVLLMAAAYFIGAAMACIIRRSLFRPKPAAVAARSVEPLPEVAARSADAARFGGARSAKPQRAPAAAPATQDLQNICGIDAATAASLNKLGIARYEQIAAWMRADVDRFSLALGQKGRISQENWIEQAQILAKGGATLYSIRRAAGVSSTAAPTPDEGDRGPPVPDAPLPRPMSRVGVSAAVVAPPPEPKPAAATPPLVSERAAFASQKSTAPAAGIAADAADTAAAVPIRPTDPPHHDNLCRIGGITPEIEQTLNALGVSRYSEIAQWSPAAVERIDRELGTSGRIARENWIEQAQILSRGGDTRFSREFDIRAQGQAPRPIKLPDAIREHEATLAAGKVQAPARTDLGSLRSVRSKAYQDTSEPGPEAARRVASRSRVVRGGADDLKRIRGVGVLTEKRLNAMGVTTYEDIANWTREDIDRVSQSLDFKGRIERENWVEQARILSSGGDTEFSRRVDRREVETSRLKT
jgi:predicted flap endonuclease-1-like 5' DNA nuclease